MTGESILSKCEKARKSLEKSLVQIQDMVPVMLAAEVGQVSHIFFLSSILLQILSLIAYL